MQTTRFSLKELQTRKSKLVAELERLNIEAKEKNEVAKSANEEIKTHQRKISEIDREIKHFSDAEPVVTEHALLRYIQHKLNLDIDALKAEILTEDTIEKIKTLGSGKFPIVGGYKAVVKDNFVVSVVPED